MTSVATYQVLSDTATELERLPLFGEDDRDLTLPFIWPERMVTGDITRRAIFATRLIPEVSTRWSVLLDSTPIIDGLFHHAGSVITVQEVIDLTPFAPGRVPGQSVPITVRVLSGQARFSDIVIWYHEDLPSFVPQRG